MKRRAPAAYRAVLRLYPASFRERSGAELEDIAANLMTQGNRTRVVSALVADALLSLPGAWHRELRQVRGRDARSARDSLGTLWTETRQAARRLRRSPGYTAAAIATLTLGIGATTAIWAVVDAALLRPLPYEEADRLVVLTSTRGGDEISVSYPDLLDWRERSRTLDGPAGFVAVAYNLTGESEAARILARGVTADLFGILGVAPVLGRVFTAEEDRPGVAPVVVLSHALWQTRYGGVPNIIGRTLLLNDVPFTVVGVMPEGFAFPDGIVFGPADLWVPAGAVATPDWQDRQSHPGIIAIGRLRPGETVESARAEMTGIAAALEAEHPATNRDEGVLARPALDVMVGDLRGALYVLAGAVALLLLIACLNVANLSLVRGVAQRRELVVRAALGAGRGRIALHVLSESLLLALAGGALGLLLSMGAVRAAATMIEGLPRLDRLTLDARVIAFTALLSFSTAALFGLAPALRNAAAASGRLRAASGTRVSAGRTGGPFVIAQVSLALVLLVGASALVRSFAALQSADGGIRAEGVVSFSIRLPSARYEGAPTTRFYDELFRDISALPGVLAAGGISTLPFSGAGAQSGIAPAGAAREDEVRTDVNVVTPGYFDALGIELLRGRVFEGRDRDGSPAVVVVDERFADRFWPGEDPIGKQVQGWGLPAAEIIGVVRHVKNYGVHAESRQELYMPHAQRPFLSMNVLVRTDEPAAVYVPLRDIVQRLDPDIPVDNIRSMAAVVAGTVATPRLAAFLSAVFAALATLLAAVGLYGVIAYGVNLRVQEIGTRMALGARPDQVLRLVTGQALGLAVPGVALGLVGAWAFSRLLEGMVFGVSPRDPEAFFGLSALLLGVAVLAGALPALRAARISPLAALRDG